MVIDKNLDMRLDNPMRVKFIRDYRGNKKGSTLEVSPNEAFGLIDAGNAIVTKDLVPDDYKQAGDKNGKPTKLRPHN